MSPTAWWHGSRAPTVPEVGRVSVVRIHPHFRTFRFAPLCGPQDAAGRWPRQPGCLCVSETNPFEFGAPSSALLCTSETNEPGGEHGPSTQSHHPAVPRPDTAPED